MSEGIGSYIRELRIGQRLNTAVLAQKAGIRRATLSEWQSGKRQPRLPELDAVLNALNASDTQKRKAREFLRTPTQIMRLREATDEKQRELIEVAGTAPHGGDLIRAMRLRKGWTQATLAEKMGVSQATIVRWERAEGWLDTASLHTLCYLLGAHEGELTALTVGRFSLSEQQPALTEEDIRAQLRHALFETRYSWSDYALTELRLLNLMAHAWSMAKQSRSGQHLLAFVNMEYADHLFLQRRFGECRAVANRTLDIYSALQLWDNNTNRVAIRLAEASAQNGSRQGLAKAISLMQRWLPHAFDPIFAGWMLRNLANFQAAGGKKEEAIVLARKALEITAQNIDSLDLHDYRYRLHDLAWILLQANRVQEAREIIAPDARYPICQMVSAEVYHRSGEPDKAHSLMEAVRTAMENTETISTFDTTYYRPEVETLAEQLEGAGSNK